MPSLLVMEIFGQTWALSATTRSIGAEGYRALLDPARSSAVGFAFTLIVIYIFSRGIYNLYFHPLCKIPGPRVAAVSSFYDFWYDVIKGGTYLWEIRKMHEIYGNILVPCVPLFTGIISRVRQVLSFASTRTRYTSATLDTIVTSMLGVAEE